VEQKEMVREVWADNGHRVPRMIVILLQANNDLMGIPQNTKEEQQKQRLHS
jgi:alpha-D-ribose 1-methylphosphonate 5-triphosphate synthase subunit PhnH